MFWGSLGALAWTHAGYPLAAAALARLRPRPVRKDDATPDVSVIVAAHDEEDVIARRVENLLELDYPAERLEIVVASDGSTDRTDEIVEGLAARAPNVKLLRVERAGKATAQNRAVAESDAEVVAFSDANSRWEPDALRKLVRSFGDPEVGYVCGQLRLESADGASQEGAVLAVRALAARERVRDRLDHRRQRRHLRRAPLGLPRLGRPVHRPRLRAPVPARAARSPRRVRARGRRLGEARGRTSRTSTGGRCG